MAIAGNVILVRPQSIDSEGPKWVEERLPNGIVRPYSEPRRRRLAFIGECGY